jgi:hypothetical protein
MKYLIILLLISGLLVSPCIAQNQQPVAIKVKDISAGQFSYPHPTDVLVSPNNAAYELLNVDIDRIGVRSKRKGYALIANDLGSVKIAGLSAFNPTGGSRLLVSESNGTVYTWNGLDATHTSSKTGLTAANQSDLVVAGNKLFRLSQTDNIWSFNGSAWTDEADTNTSFPKVKMAIWTSTQRMLAANSSAYPHFLWYSNSGVPQTWDRTTNAYKIGQNNADGVTGLIEFTNYEVITFTKDAMYLLDIGNTTPSNWTQAKIADIGCVAHRTVKQVGGDVLFLSSDGVRSIMQSAQDKKRGASLPLSYPIQDWIDKINWQYVDRACAGVWQDKYYLSVPIDTTYNNYTFVFSRRAFEANEGKGGWTIYENCMFNDYAVQTFSDMPTRFYTGENQADGKVYQFRSLNPSNDTTSDNGTTITYSETSKRYDFGSPELEKTFEMIEVEATTQASGTITVKAQVDAGGWTTLGSFVQTGDLPKLPINLPFYLKGENIKRKKYDLTKLGRGRDIQVKLTESTLNAPTEVLNYLIVGYQEAIQWE